MLAGGIRRGLELLAVTVPLCWARPLLASEPVAYTAPSSCVSSEEFGQRLQSRGGVDVAATRSRFAVRIEAEETGFAGELTRDGSSIRAIHGASCETVVDALVLVIALAADSEPASEPAAPTLAVGARENSSDAIAPRPASPAPSFWTIAVGAQGSVAAFATPTVGLAGSLFGEIGAGSRGLVSPRVRLGVERTLAESAAFGGARASFTRTVLRLDGCPFVLSARENSLDVTACGRIDGGVLGANGEAAIASESVNRPWFAAGGAARVRWEVLRPVFLELEGGITFPLIRDAFFFGPSGTATSRSLVPPVAVASAGIGAGVRFH